MARLIAVVVTDDEELRKQVVTVLRSGAVPVGINDERLLREGAPVDLIVVDARRDAAIAMPAIERLRAVSSSATIIALAGQAQPQLILQAMRAGANEFVTWPFTDNSFEEAIGRTAQRRETAPGARPQATTLAFLGAKGGAGTTTLAVNCAVDLARLSKRPTIIVDLKPGLGEVSLFLGVRNRYSLLDALDNLHRLDGEFMRELVAKHKSGLEILAGSDQFDRPSPADSAAIEEVMRLLTRQYEHVIIDVGSQINGCATAALYAADLICLVANPDVPSVRNAQRLLGRIQQLGLSSERVRVLLNRAAEPYPIPPAQIEGALGHPIDHTFPSDYRTVSAALNSGVPLALTGATDLAAQFDSFARRILDPQGETAQPSSRKNPLNLQRLASLW